ncbi:MAG: saccharopine dehydrogenase family protein [Planctomycetota bacterium]|jgi:lysine 6-dehydrogenase
MRYAVLGAGRQGVAIAYDLARHGEARAITLVEADRRRLQAGAARLRRLAPDVKVTAVGKRLRGPEATALLRGHDAAVSALPYRLNPALARAAVRARVSFCDLGGNTALVREELKLDGEARSAGVTVVPDCGLAPGLGNVLAAIAIDAVPGARHVRIRCGGLPIPPRGPLGYSLLFDIAGLTNEYTGEAVVLRGGRVRRLEAFTEVEPYRGPRSLGPLEAFLTSGGTSTAPWTFQDKLETYDYKTVRYRGHFEKVRAMIELGLLDLGPVEIRGHKVVPRDLFHAVAGPRLLDPKVKDVALLQVDCTDRRGRGIRYRMVHPFDRKTGFTAMEQTTGYPTAVVAHALARKQLKPGAVTPERAGFGAEHLAALRRRGLAIRRTRLS